MPTATVWTGPKRSPAMNSEPGWGAISALLIVIAVSVWLGTLAQRAIQRGKFLTGYFLGNRGLGAWALALTATVQSGGTFMGYPSLVYTHGWIVALWIGSYMVVPITGFGALGKRFAQLSRRTGAITVPDLLRIRFGSPAVGLISSLFIIAFMSSMMVAQFKAGAIVMKLSLPGNAALALSEEGGVDPAYYIGLAVFTLTVVGYTLIGGFLASVWTDLFQSVLMLIGVMILFFLVVPLVPGEPMQRATLEAVGNTGPNYAFGPGFSADGRQFLPVGLAFSFFVVWIFGGAGSPAGQVRLMASHDTPTIRRSMVLLAFYNTLIYLPLLIICVASRSILPNLASSDELIPRLSMWATRDIPGGSFVSGLILAAPFGAVMATVSTYLVVIASGVVRDVYLRFIRPHAGQTEVRRVSQGVMIFFGLFSVALNINPVAYLQAIVIFSTSSVAATLLVPTLMAAYWRRATVPGAICAMIVGSATTMALFGAGWWMAWQGYDQEYGLKTAFRPYFLAGLEPIVWGLAASFVSGVVVSLLTRPPDAKLVSWLFDRQPEQSDDSGGRSSR
ncbi:MAG: sodium:solute symporter [Planctomycetia bacterium]|nr:sodium:solute symporter [Planctomycetia bacterium]